MKTKRHDRQTDGQRERYKKGERERRRDMTDKQTEWTLKNWKGEREWRWDMTDTPQNQSRVGYSYHSIHLHSRATSFLGFEFFVVG